MFKALGALLALLWSAVLSADDAPQDGPPADEPPADTPADEILLKFSDDAAKQDWLDRQFSERYGRKRKEIREEERASVEAELRERALQEQEQWKELAENRSTKIEELQNRVSELEGAASEVDPLNARIVALEERLRGVVKPRLDAVPDLWRPFVEDMTVEQQAEWLEKNGDKLGAGDPTGLPPTPDPARRDRGRESREADKEAEEASRQRVASRL